MADRPDMKNRPPQRFPRLPKGDIVGNLAKKVWKEPTFRMRETKHATEFIFHLPYSVTREIKKRSLSEMYKEHQVGLHAALFQPKERWTEAFGRAYSSEVWNGKRLRQWFKLYLYRLYLGAFRMLLRDTAVSLGEEYYEWYEGQIKKLRETGKRRAGRRSAPRQEQRQRTKQRKRMEKNFAARYEALKPQVKQLREFIEGAFSEGPVSEEKLKRQIRRKFKHGWIYYVINGAALDNYQDIYTGIEERDVLLGALNWTVSSLTVSIMGCEQKTLDPRFRPGPRTLYEKYILRKGKRRKRRVSSPLGR